MHLKNCTTQLFSEKCKYFSLYLDESTNLFDISQVVILVRTIQEDFNAAEKMLDLIPLHGTTKSADIFKAGNKAIEHTINVPVCH